MYIHGASTNSFSVFFPSFLRNRYYAAWECIICIFFAYLCISLILCIFANNLAKDSMKNYIIPIVWSFCALCFVAQPMHAALQDDLRLLDNTLAQKQQFDQQKEKRIHGLKATQPLTFDVAKQLFNEYKSYNYDQGKYYADLLVQYAETSGDARQLYETQCDQVFALLSAGLFKEGYDLLQSIWIPAGDTLGLVNYHIIFARLMLDMAVYSGDKYATIYHAEQRRHYEQAAALLTPRDTFLYNYCRASVAEFEGDWIGSIAHHQRSLKSSTVSPHDTAVAYSSIAFAYQQMGNREMMMHYNILSAVADIRSSTKEAISLRRVAQTLYEDGYLTLAARYIREAKEDAEFYGARHREMELMQILPIIDAENAKLLQKQNSRILIWVFVSFVFLLITLAAMCLLYRRMRQIRAARATIEDMNNSLLVANRLKEEYIGTALCWQSQYLGEMERYQQMVRKRIHEKRYDDILTIPKNADAHRQREEFYKRFDEMFLGIFPSFVADFNALLRPDGRIVLKSGELLNTELRIFALLRLGVTHSEVIAQVLDYNITTIYTYKTKVKGRSDLSNEEFFRRLMLIPSFASERKNK